MAILDPKSKYAVLINTFEVAPEKADELVDLLKDATKQVMSRIDGFVSANLHVSTDKKRVVNYAQWRDKAAFDAMQKNPEAGKHMAAAAKLATSFDPVFYDLRYSESAA
jgi:quinol monooxygenase YgiN